MRNNIYSIIKLTIWHIFTKYLPINLILCVTIKIIIYNYLSYYLIIYKTIYLTINTTIYLFRNLTIYPSFYFAIYKISNLSFYFYSVSRPTSRPTRNSHVCCTRNHHASCQLLWNCRLEEFFYLDLSKNYKFLK